MDKEEEISSDAWVSAESEDAFVVGSRRCENRGEEAIVAQTKQFKEAYIKLHHFQSLHLMHEFDLKVDESEICRLKHQAIICLDTKFLMLRTPYLGPPISIWC